MTETIPPGFRPVSDNHRPPKGDTKYEVIFRNGLHDDRGYTASQLNWIHTGWAFDVVAVRDLPLGFASALIADADNVIDGRLRFASAMAQANLARRYRRPIKPNGPA